MLRSRGCVGAGLEPAPIMYHDPCACRLGRVLHETHIAPASVGSRKRSTQPTAWLELDDLWFNALVGDANARKANRQAEPSRACAARVEIKHTLAPVDGRLVRVAEYDGRGARFDGINRKRGDVVQNIKVMCCRAHRPA